MNAHVAVGDEVTVVTVDDRTVSLPVGISSLGAGLATDPPRPEELTNAIGAVADHLVDVVRELPDLVGATVSMSGAEVTAVASIELGAAASLPFELAREAAEDVFRTVATEPVADRSANPGLDRDLVERVVAGACAVVGVMRTLHLDVVVVTADAPATSPVDGAAP